MRWRSRFLVLAGLIGLALAGCIGDIHTPEVTFLTFLGPEKGLSGDTFSIEYVVDFAADYVVDIYADVDGNLLTQGDRITIAAGRPVRDGVAEQVDWTTTGLDAAVYRIFVVVRTDSGFEFVFEAPGKAIVSIFSFSGFSAIRMVMRGQSLAIAYADNCPAGPATTDLFADGDGNLLTTGDQVLIEAGRIDQDGAVQQALWDTTGVAPGSYFIMAVFSEGPLVLATIVAPAQVVVNDVTEMLPAHGTDLLGTAANTRVRFAVPLVQATIDATTMPVTIGTLPVAGAYTTENGNRDVVFTPQSCFFLAPAEVRCEVLNTVAETTLAPATIRTATFRTAASKIYCGTSDGGRLSVVDPIGLAETSTVAIGPRDAAFFAVASSRGLLFIGTSATSADGTVVVFDAALNGVLGRIPLTKNSPTAFVTVAGVALSPDEAIVCAAAYEGAGAGDPDATAFLSLLDAANRTETVRLDLSRPGRLKNLVVTQDGARAYVANYDASAIHVIGLAGPAELDTDGDGSNGITPIPTAAFPAGTALDAAGAQLFVTHADPGGTLDVSVFDTATFAALTPLAAAGVGIHAPVIRSNVCDGMLYAPRTNAGGIDLRPALSVFDVAAGSEALPQLLVDSQGYYLDIAFVYGTTLAALADHDAGNAQVFDTTDRGSGAVAAPTSIARMTTVTTIPPLRP